MFESPVAVEQSELVYPRDARRYGREGWVELNFMVDAQGKAYEITVADNIGDRDFITAAIRHLEDTVFSPAHRGDEVVDGSGRMLYTFRIDGGAPGAGGVFSGRYRQFINTLEDSSQERAADALRVLEEGSARNIYEYAYLSLARFFYAERYGTPLEQMEHLSQALRAGDDPRADERYLGEETVAVRRVLFQLQVQNAYYAEALGTFAVMQREGDGEGVALFKTAADQLEALRNSNQRYDVQGRIADNGYWDISLLQDEFQLDNVDGAVEELKLRCEASFVFFEFDPKVLYRLSESAGDCNLQVIGDPGTTFSLVQQ